jgi:signal transduction histidine kinase
MLRLRVLLALAVVSLPFPAFAKSHLPASNTRAAVRQYVLDAAAHVKKHGADCAAFNGPDWKGGDYYIFVGEGGKTVCHPNPKMVGRSQNEIVDANGKNVGHALDAASGRKGGGWADYVWPRPGTDKPVAKSTYSIRVKGPDGKDYQVGGGGYELK